MTLIAVGAGKGGPGVTTASVALAAVWPRPAVLAECDLAGSDLPYRLPARGGGPLARDRGVVSLASAARGSVGPEVVWEHTQELDGGLPVLVGPSRPAQAAAMASAWTPISGMLAGLPGTDVIADCGQLLGETPLVPVLRRASLIVLVVRDTVEGVAHLRHALVAVAAAVNAQGSSAGSLSALQRTAVLLVTERQRAREATGQVQQILAGSAGLADVVVLGTLAYDPVGAAGLGGQWGRRLDRSALITSARTAAQTAFHRVHVGDGPAQSTDVAGPPAGMLPRQQHSSARRRP